MDIADQVLTTANPLWLSGSKPGGIPLVTEIKLRAKTATFSEGLQTSPAGASYNPQITVPIPSIASEIVEWVYRNQNRRFIAIFRDTAGFCFMAGTKTGYGFRGRDRYRRPMHSSFPFPAPIGTLPYGSVASIRKCFSHQKSSITASTIVSLKQSHTMPWNPPTAEIEGIIDGNLKSSPPPRPTSK